MATILTRANITDAISAVEAYELRCNNLHQDLNSTLTSLASSNWNGDGSDGCMDFYRGTIEPAITESLQELTTAVKGILNNIADTCLDNVDPQLGEANRNPGA